MTNTKPASDKIPSKVALRLVDPLGKNIIGLKYEVRDVLRIVAKGVTDAEGKLASFTSVIGTILTVHVERFGTQEMKLIKKIIPWSEDFRMKLVSGKRKDKLIPQKDEGHPGTYKRKTYKVKQGDTLGAIAPHFGTTAAELAKLNNMALTDLLHIDQVLKVPMGPADAAGAANSGAETQESASPAVAPETPAPMERSAAPATAEEHNEKQEGAASEVGLDAEPGVTKTQPIATPVETTAEEERGENGTPKTSVSPVCDQSGCIKLGDKGQLVEELNLRLMGFGNTVDDSAALDEFTVATEKAVKQFQRDYMGVAQTGKVCGKVLAAIDDFLVKYPLPYANLACQCQDHQPGNQGCTGFGMARTESGSVGHLKNGSSKPGVERPGIHRGLFWSLRAALYYLHGKESHLGFRFQKISSGYRCWKRAKQMGIFTINHLGDACDVHFKRNNEHVHGNELESLKNKVLVGIMGANPNWSLPNRISLEPQSITDQWVHMDVRKFEARYKLDRFYAKTREAADGDSLLTMAKREGRFGLINCGGIALTPAVPSQVPATATPPVAVPAAATSPPKPKPPSPVVAPKSSGPAEKTNGAKAGPQSTERVEAKKLRVSQLGLDFIRTWESGNLQIQHLHPYADSRGFCTIGVGHLIDGEYSCAKLKSMGSKEYKLYENGFTDVEESALFAEDVREVRNRILVSIHVPLHQHEFDALMSLAFNTGGLSKFKKLLAKLNTGNYSGCCDEFGDITNGGVESLIKRRKSEMKLFRNNVYDAEH